MNFYTKLYRKKHASIFLGIIVLLIVIIMIFPKVIEKFDNSTLSSGQYPCTSSYPLLYNDYPLKTPPSLSDLGYTSIWTDYPILPSSHNQITNNKRYWNIPENGECSPAEFCNTIYTEKKYLQK